MIAIITMMIIAHDACDSMVLLKKTVEERCSLVSSKKTLQAQTLLAANTTCLYAFVSMSLMPAPPFYLPI